MFVPVVPGKAFVGLMKKGGSSWSAFCGGWCVFEFHILFTYHLLRCCSPSPKLKMGDFQMRGTLFGLPVVGTIVDWDNSKP